MLFLLQFEARPFCQGCVWKQLVHSYANTSEDRVISGEEKKKGIVGSSETIGSDNLTEHMRAA